jgi:hypothetical protein
MKKHFVTAIAFLATTAAFAQTTKKDSTSSIVHKPPVASAPAPAKKDWSKVVLNRKSSDHFILEFGYNSWSGVPDSIRIRGFNRTVNAAVMFDFPFKSDKRLSLAAGGGIGVYNTFFDQQEVLVAAYGNSTLAFQDDEGSNHYKKFKLVTTFLQIPLELRFALDPEHSDKSWKFAVGAKLGLLLSSYTKAKDLENSQNQIIGNYIQKESSKQFFNTTQLVPTIRINKGIFGIYGEYQVTSLLKASAGPSIFPFSFGIVMSGL